MSGGADGVVFFFGRCAKGLTVETTAWEDRFDGSVGDGDDGK